jgi:hypothetical protein
MPGVIASLWKRDDAATFPCPKASQKKFQGALSFRQDLLAAVTSAEGSTDTCGVRRPERQGATPLRPALCGDPLLGRDTPGDAPAGRLIGRREAALRSDPSVARRRVYGLQRGETAPRVAPARPRGPAGQPSGRGGFRSGRPGGADRVGPRSAPAPPGAARRGSRRRTPRRRPTPPAPAPGRGRARPACPYQAANSCTHCPPCPRQHFSPSTYPRFGLVVISWARRTCSRVRG